MRIISTKISNDSLSSKLPGIIPSIVDSWSLPSLYACNFDDDEKYYSYSSAVKRAYEYNINASELEYGTEFISFDKKNLVEFSNGNYSLIPSDVIIPKEIADKITDYTDMYVNIPITDEEKLEDDRYNEFYDLSWPVDDNDPHYDGRKIVSGETHGEIKVLTYSTLNKWYVFFKDYYNLIKNPSYERTYSSATEYYESEIKVKNKEQQNKYSSMDDVFNSRGGKDMYEWISNNCIIQYNIPEEYVNAWKTTYLYLPDALRWYQWFNERFDKYKYVSYLEECKDTDDCCDCTEFLKLGGNDFFLGKDRKSGLKAWIDSLNFDTSYATKSASFSVSVNIMNSIDDFGEMAILSNEWEDEVDYHNTLEEKGYETLDNHSGGTVVVNPRIKHCRCRHCGYENVPITYENKEGKTIQGFEVHEGDIIGGTCNITSSRSELNCNGGLIEFKARNTACTIVQSASILPCNGGIVNFRLGSRNIDNILRCPICGSELIDTLFVTLEDTFMIKNGNHKGYYYDSFYDNVFKYIPDAKDEYNDWIPYTDYYIGKNLNEFASNGLVHENYEMITGYTISPINGKIVYNPTPEDITINININRVKSTSINGITYDVIDGKYVQLCYETNTFANLKYKKHEKLQIFKDGNLEYAILNGKRKYVEYDSNDTEGLGRVYFLKESNCHDDGCPVSEGKYVIYDNCLYLTDGDLLTINDDDSNRVYTISDGYFDVDSYRLYILNGDVVIPDKAIYDENYNYYSFKYRKIGEEELSIMNLSKIEINDDNTATLYYNYSTTNCGVITGRTDSKLSLLRRKEITTDDLGTELPGYFKSIVDINKGVHQSRYNVPYDECTLDILYKVGEVSGLYPNNNLKSSSKKYYDGNIITDIEFYYLDENGIKKISVKANDDNALDAIKLCEEQYSESEDYSIVNSLYCDITYHIGAVIEKTDNKYKLSEEFHSGVKYVDTLYVTKQVGTYYMSQDKSFTFNYYLLTQGKEKIYLSEFNDKVLWDASTVFEMVLPLYYSSDENEDDIAEQNSEIIKYYSGWSENNNVMAAPLFRNEFNLASSYPQNVDANIYIDRGINAAFEKHLKLQEVRTMEALENYTNNYFNITKY